MLIAHPDSSLAARNDSGEVSRDEVALGFAYRHFPSDYPIVIPSGQRGIWDGNSASPKPETGEAPI